jgi:hypothetical protein
MKYMDVEYIYLNVEARNANVEFFVKTFCPMTKGHEVVKCMGCAYIVH